MNVTTDFEALYRSLLIGIAAGLIVSYLTYRFINLPKGKLIMLCVGIILVISTFLFILWPSLVEVPDLSNLSLAEAEDKLYVDRLIPDSHPLQSDIEEGRVIPGSQKPRPKIKVRPGTVVSFAISQGSPSSIISPDKLQSSNVSVKIFHPMSGTKLTCIRYPDRIYRCDIIGTSSGLSPNLGLLLWVKPVNPPSETPGWYLQRSPINGITAIDSSGSWKGVIQIGNSQWPPNEGDIFDLAVTVTKTDVINTLNAELGVVIKDEPVGIKSDRAFSVKITLNK